MYYYLIELENPKKILRSYRNSRVANYTVVELNKAAGFEKYAYLESESPITVDYVGENPVEAKVQFLADSNKPEYE